MQKYLHESRHRHAMKRVRGEGGRFNSNLPALTTDAAAITSVKQDNGAGSLGLVFQVKEERQQTDVDSHQLAVTTVSDLGSG